MSIAVSTAVAGRSITNMNNGVSVNTYNNSTSSISDVVVYMSNGSVPISNGVSE